MNLKTTRTTEETVVQFPCMTCGYDGQLKLWQDRRYDTATVTCPKCDRSERGNCSWNEDYAGCIAKIWNPYNDRQNFINNCQEALNDLLTTKKRLTRKLAALKKGLFLKDIGGDTQ